MLRKTLIGALVLALTPALAFAAPMTTKHEMTAKPAVTHTIKLHKKTHQMKKAEKIRVIQKHRTVKKMRAVSHLKRHRTLEHKI
jgi:cell division protein FtsX